MQNLHDSDEPVDFLDILREMDGDLDAHFRDQVIAWRNRRGWNQTELARRLAETLPAERQRWAKAPNINRYELGKLGIDFTIAHGLARALRVPFTTLLGPLPQDVQKLVTALDDPRVQAFAQLLESRRLKPSDVVAVLNSLLYQARLPMIEQPGGPLDAAKD